MITVEELVASEMPLDLLAQSFRDFYCRDPWNEYLRCPTHSPFDDFGAAGRVEDPSLANCPDCENPLLPYWSDERVACYFEMACNTPGFFGVFGKNNNGDVVAWAWAYGLDESQEFADCDPGGCYVDVIGVLPQYRDESDKVAVEGHLVGLQKGYKYFVTRTHKRAHYVHEYLRRAGYEYLKTSQKEPDREYWILNP